MFDWRESFISGAALDIADRTENCGRFNNDYC